MMTDWGWGTKGPASSWKIHRPSIWLEGTHVVPRPPEPLFLGVIISQLNSLSVCVPSEKLWHTPLTRSMQRPGKIQDHVQHFSFLYIYSMSQAGFWNIPGTKKFTLVSRSEGSFKGTQFAKQNWTSNDLRSGCDPILPLWLMASTQLVLNRCSLWERWSSQSSPRCASSV